MTVKSITQLLRAFSFACLLFASFRPAQAANILIVYSQMAEPYTTFMRHFHQALSGIDLTYQTINLNNREKVVAHLLTDKTTEKPDAILAVGTIALRAIHGHDLPDNTIPVFFAMVSDPISEGVIDAFNVPPKGKFTGVSFSIDIRHRLRALKQLLPHAKNVGVIYSTMPQSISFKNWVDEVAQEPEFSDLSFVFRRTGTLPYKNTPTDMAKTAKRHVLDIKDQVDVYLSPSDQMGAAPHFAQMIVRETGKPVFGLTQQDVNAPKAAFAASAPRLAAAGQNLASQVIAYLNGTDFKTLHPTQPAYDLVINQQTADLFKISTRGF